MTHFFVSCFCTCFSCILPLVSQTFSDTLCFVSMTSHFVANFSQEFTDTCVFVSACACSIYSENTLFMLLHCSTSFCSIYHPNSILCNVSINQRPWLHQCHSVHKVFRLLVMIHHYCFQMDQPLLAALMLAAILQNPEVFSCCASLHHIQIVVFCLLHCNPICRLPTSSSFASSVCF